MFDRRAGAAGLRVVTFALLAGCKAQPPAPATPASAAAAPPLWLVTIVVDQMAAWMADERWNALPSDGGFARLLREGTYVRELRFAHSNTETAPGARGAVHGRGAARVRHRRQRRARPRRQEGVELAATRARGWCRRAPPVRSIAMAARWRRCGSTRWRTRWSPRARAPRSTACRSRIGARCSAAGRHPKLVLWLDTEGGTLVTSTAFAQAVPAWAAPFADGAAVARAFAQPWEPLDAGWLAAHVGDARRPGGRGRLPGHGHDVPAPRAVGEGDAGDAGGRSAVARAGAGGRRARRRDRGGPAGADRGVAVVARLREPRVRTGQLGVVGRAAPPRSRSGRAARGAGHARGTGRLRGHVDRRSRKQPAARDRTVGKGRVVPERRAARATTGNAPAAAAAG